VEGVLPHRRGSPGVGSRVFGRPPNTIAITPELPPASLPQIPGYKVEAVLGRVGMI
jgi:hypothetical protein